MKHSILSDTEALQELKDSLAVLMQREMGVMREVLSNLLAEQDALIGNHTEAVKVVLSQRDELTHTLTEVRRHRLEKQKELARLHAEGKDSISVDFYDYLDPTDSNNITLFSVREQMHSVVEKIDAQNKRNQYLLHKKVSFNSQLMDRLNPANKNKTYGPAGHYKAKTKVATMTIINREG